MVKLFIVIKRKGTKKWLGAIPVRPGLSMSRAREAARKQVKSSFSYKVVTETQLKKAFLPKKRKRKGKR